MDAELTAHGLNEVGYWMIANYASISHLRPQCPFGIGFELPEEWKERPNVVYAFVVGTSVMYVGETGAGMRSRFAGYRYGNPLVRDTDNRVKLGITQALTEGNLVHIWASQPIAHLTLPTGILEGPASKLLEGHLIDLFRPPWNRHSPPKFTAIPSYPPGLPATQ
ncbi:GIY-YIG domain-containing protein [Paraburkholderia sacchari]|uniref:hypothetical protein n=1 Tax=Paraburkholderia sacchari TaxID=159450 RepID=UPI0039A5B165